MGKERKTFPKNWRDLWRKGTHKHTGTYLKYFDGHKRLSQSEESKCMWIDGKDGVTREFLIDAIRGLHEKKVGGEEGMEGK